MFPFTREKIMLWFCREVLASQGSQPLQRDVLTRMWPSAFCSPHEIPASSGQAACSPQNISSVEMLVFAPDSPRVSSICCCRTLASRTSGVPGRTGRRSEMLAAPGGQPAVSPTRIPAGTTCTRTSAFPCYLGCGCEATSPWCNLSPQREGEHHSAGVCTTAMPVASTGEHPTSWRYHIFFSPPCSPERRKKKR